MTTKLKRCTSPGCRTLTADTLCGDHRETPTPNPAGENLRTLIAALQAGAEKAGLWQKNADRIDALRTDLRALREYGESIERRNEQPVFKD